MPLLLDLWCIIFCEYLPYWENVHLLESEDTFHFWYPNKELERLRKRWVKEQTVQHTYHLEKFGYGILVYLDGKLHNEDGPAKLLRHIDRTNQYGENHTLIWCHDFQRPEKIIEVFFYPNIEWEPFTRWLCGNKRGLWDKKKEDSLSISNDLNSKAEYYIGGLRHRIGGPAVLFVAKPGGVLDGLKEKDDEYWENGLYQPYVKDIVGPIFLGLLFGILLLYIFFCGRPRPK